MAIARIGIGSNLGDAAANVERAIASLARLGVVLARSSLYVTKAWGVEAQPDFVNAAALLDTALEPRELLVALQGLESELGRSTTFRWGPRSIDLDILAYDDLTLNEPGLTIPHAHLLERGFALAPLAEIDPSFRPAWERLSEAARGAVRLLGRG